jgi:hypothetical protein
VPLFSPHDLRHRRISLLHLRGMPWARIGEFVGQRSLSVTGVTSAFASRVAEQEHHGEVAGALGASTTYLERRGGSVAEYAPRAA